MLNRAMSDNIKIIYGILLSSILICLIFIFNFFIILDSNIIYNIVTRDSNISISKVYFKTFNI